MSSSISSAEWSKLFRYSDRGLQIDRELVAEASRLAGVLRHFEATCTEYRVSVSHLAGDIRGYAHRAEGTDVWVRTVGVDFQRADQIGSVVFGGDTLRQILIDILIAERAARVGFAKGLRFRPYAGWGAFFRDTILKFGYRGKWTVLGPRSALRAAGIFKNVRWFSYKHLTKVLTIKSGSWTGAARAAFNRMLRQPGSIFRKLPGAIDAFVRKMPRNSPYLPVATFKQRLGEAFGKGASIGGKLKSAAGIGLLITAAENIYEYHWGINRHLGLRSRQFVTSTLADGSATLGIIAVMTAVGTAIPIPVVGTVAGFIVGVCLAVAYETWGKDAWRNAVDGAGKRLQDALTPAQRAEQVQSYKEQRDMARGAADVSQSRVKDIPRVSLTPSPSAGAETTSRLEPPKLSPADPSKYDSCALYAQARRNDLKETGGDGGAYNYIQKFKDTPKYYRISSEVAGNGLDHTPLRPGTAVIWDKSHPEADPTWGHVAIIEEVGSDYIVVSEANYGTGTRRKIPATSLPELHFVR